MQAIEPFVVSSRQSDNDKLSSSTVDFTLRSADALRPMLAAANNTVLINSFSPLMPSMDEIFISAVENSNNTTTQPPVYNEAK